MDEDTFAVFFEFSENNFLSSDSVLAALAMQAHFVEVCLVIAEVINTTITGDQKSWLSSQY